MRNLITLVAPIDFSAKDGLLFSWSKQMNVDAIIDTYRIVPGDFLNAGYLMLLPFNLYVKKYKDMLSFVDDEEKLSNFLRMEKWIFDSPGQAGECLRQFLKDLYQENRLVKGTLKIGDRLVNLNKITVPLLNIYATYDHLVPPASSRPLNDLVSSSDKSSYEFKGGHIGVFVSEKSQEELGPAIARWLHAHDQQVKSDGLPEKASGRAKTHYKSRTTSSKMKSSRPE
jgi:polyhydroxyalkanoate synthase